MKTSDSRRIAIFDVVVKILISAIQGQFSGDCPQFYISKDLIYHWDDIGHIGELTELSKCFYAQFSKGERFPTPTTLNGNKNTSRYLWLIWLENLGEIMLLVPVCMSYYSSFS